MIETGSERHSIFLGMDPNCDAPGVSDAERTEDHDDINSVKLPRGSATSHDELDIVGVSTHDIDDLEKDVIQNILGEDVDSARGFELFTRSDSPLKCRCSPSTSSSGETSACGSGSDDEYIPMDGDNDMMSEGSFSEPADAEDECKQVPSLGRRQKTSKPKTTVSTYVDDSNDNDFKERLSTTFSSDVGDNTDYKELTDSLRISRQVWDRLYK
ncbi:hypothetical protein Y032_0472g2064 [Ancylostoma ceylanicum]|uniref:Uncharacterized protein n=1 Tax=Ancylostoma ceylanicum TaxID=53326 RepID=A0A016WYL9_9BILA|nr:hypothetical protein Y032_0472g2064 [Ancylostoma ceylanicum]